MRLVCYKYSRTRAFLRPALHGFDWITMPASITTQKRTLPSAEHRWRAIGVHPVATVAVTDGSPPQRCGIRASTIPHAPPDVPLRA